MKHDYDIPEKNSEESHLPAGEPSHIPNDGNISNTSESESRPAVGEPSQPPPAVGEPSTLPTSQGATVVPSSNSTVLDVMDIHSPIVVYKGGLYANKDALQKSLSMFATNNHFMFKVRTSTTQYLYVVCRDDYFKWTVRAIRLKNPIISYKEAILQNSIYSLVT